jgi:hypothetical protein
MLSFVSPPGVSAAAPSPRPQGAVSEIYLDFSGNVDYGKLVILGFYQPSSIDIRMRSSSNQLLEDETGFTTFPHRRRYQLFLRQCVTDCALCFKGNTTPRPPGLDRQRILVIFRSFQLSHLTFPKVIFTLFKQT